MAGGMDQISRPLLFALIAVVGFAGVWMLVLRPQAEGGGDTAAPTPVAASTQPAAAPATGLGRAVEQARGAVTTANGAAPAGQAAGAGAPVAPTEEARAVPKAATTGQTTVLLFAGSGADDAAARDVVRSVRGPGVRVVIASLNDVGSYQDLLGSLEIAASPTILVIGADRTAQRIEGLPDVAQVQQALRAAG
jgi:hypothetical protein